MSYPAQFNTNKFSQAVTRMASSVGTDSTLLRFTKGEWLHGADDTEVEEGSRWALAPTSLRMGYCAFDEDTRELLGEITARFDEPAVTLEGQPDYKWKAMDVVQLACVSGEDKGVQVLWKCSSIGALRELARVLSEVDRRVTNNDAKVVPICELHSDHYNHKKYKKVYTPKLEIVDWVTLDATTVPALETDDVGDEYEDEELPKSRTKRAATKPAPAPEPEPEEDAPKPRRRRTRA